MFSALALDDLDMISVDDVRRELIPIFDVERTDDDASVDGDANAVAADDGMKDERGELAARLRGMMDNRRRLRGVISGPVWLYYYGHPDGLALLQSIDLHFCEL